MPDKFPTCPKTWRFNRDPVAFRQGSPNVAEAQKPPEIAGVVVREVVVLVGSKHGCETGQIPWRDHESNHWITANVMVFQGYWLKVWNSEAQESSRQWLKQSAAQMGRTWSWTPVMDLDRSHLGLIGVPSNTWPTLVASPLQTWPWPTGGVHSGQTQRHSLQGVWSQQCYNSTDYDHGGGIACGGAWNDSTLFLPKHRLLDAFEADLCRYLHLLPLGLHFVCGSLHPKLLLPELLVAKRCRTLLDAAWWGFAGCRWDNDFPGRSLHSLYHGHRCVGGHPVWCHVSAHCSDTSLQQWLCRNTPVAQP